MDEMVREAQEWVNSTYSWNPYYISCDEDGIVGQGTMKSFVCALQIALGFSYPDGGFGAETLNRMEDYGNVGPGNDSPEMCNFVGYGLWCKGYVGGAVEGVYSDTMATGVYDLTYDMGLASVPYVTPKTMKALLTTDPYTITAGGTEKIRELQQWMNGKYVDVIDSFFIAPCDGHFSRDVQQALLKAVQYEIGTPLDEIDGLFGPGTASRLQSHPLSQGDTGDLVHLFTAGCIANEGFTLDGEEQEVEFSSTYSSATTAFVSAFQEFSALGSTDGSCDFDTWAQVLVSTGNKDRAVTASDCVATITADRIGLLQAEGIVAVGRYLDEPVEPGEDGYLGKTIDPGELETMFAGGLRCFPLSQYDGRYLSNFTYTSGYSHAILAHDKARGFGFPQGTCIYFAVDYDATDADIGSNIIPYFRGVISGMKAKGNRYTVGVYGTRNVCIRISGEGYARWSFVAGMSWGYSGNLGYPLPQNWAFNQIKEQDYFFGDEPLLGLDFDVHRPGTDFGVRTLSDGPSSVDNFLSFLGDLETAAENWASSHGMDPDDARTTNRLVLHYLKYPGYGGWLWDALTESPDDAWISHADGLFEDTRVKTFNDPGTGQEISADHLGATALGTLLRYDTDQYIYGDLAGWLGDLCTFYTYWRNHKEEYPSGYTCCVERLANPLVEGSFFGLADLIEDVDGFKVGYLGHTAKATTTLTNIFANGLHQERFTWFYAGRFSGVYDSVLTVTDELLTGDFEAKSLTSALISKVADDPIIYPWALPSDDLDDFIAGWADRYVEIMENL